MSYVYDIAPDTVYTNVFSHKKLNGIDPAWWVVKGGTNYVDCDEYFKYDKIYRQAYVFATNKLYWLFIDYFNISSSQLAEVLAARSARYHSKSSWITFFSKDIWQESMLNKVNPNYTKIEDFVYIGSRYAYELIKAKKASLVT